LTKTLWFATPFGPKNGLDERSGRFSTPISISIYAPFFAKLVIGADVGKKARREYGGSIISAST